MNLRRPPISTMSQMHTWLCCTCCANNQDDCIFKFLKSNYANPIKSPRATTSHPRWGRRWDPTPPHPRSANSMYRSRSEAHRCLSRRWRTSCSGRRNRNSSPTSTPRHARPSRSEPRCSGGRRRPLHSNAHDVLSSQDDQSKRALLLSLLHYSRSIALALEGTVFLRIRQDEVEVLVEGKEGAQDGPPVRERDSETVLHIS
mmetsp:Transcript_37824/g.113099  ORF Transcript_37824/g.113099 Transcript_37824/m.113099 type:complete len:201 (-) Transcript_37824:245-847(-)